MIRPLRTVLPLLLVAFSFSAVGCSTIYRPVYSPGKSHYKKPPEKVEAVADLLPPEPTEPAPQLIEPAAPPAAPAPGMLDAPPAIPGLPQL